MTAAIRLVCAGCGAEPDPRDPYPFRCPNAAADPRGEHVLARALDRSLLPPPAELRADFLAPEPHPLLRYRRLLQSWHRALAAGLSDAEYTETVRRLDREVAVVDGHGFSPTQLLPSPDLARHLGCRTLRIKDETGNVSGSHKARHLAGLMLWLAVVREEEKKKLGRAEEGEILAIASCGNAALAAAEVARAAGRRLAVFVPPEAHPNVLARLAALGAELVFCPRERAEAGDPCYLRFREAVAAGALPFTCQGPQNGLVIEGGETLAWEIASDLLRDGGGLDRMFVQVGGGALATAVHQGLREARDLGVLDRLPSLIAVQTEGAAPLARAYDRVAERIARRLSSGVAPRAAPLTLEARAERAAWLARDAPEELLEEELRHAAAHRAEFMWPWEQVPHSLATGILDDETYDWLAVVRGMLETGGYPVVVGEDLVAEAHRLGREVAGIPADPTGTAGLAGALALARAGLLPAAEKVAVLFTGVDRGAMESPLR